VGKYCGGLISGTFIAEMKENFIKKMTFILMLLSGFQLLSQSQSINKELNPINPGEILEYKLSWGWITLGKAQVKTIPEIKYLEGRDCYEMEITGRSAGIGSLFYFDDKWGGVFDKETYIPYYSYRDLKEGKFRLKETTKFDRDSMMVFVNSEKKDGPLPEKQYKMESKATLDLISGLAFARGLDFNEMPKEKIIELTGFFEDKFYSFKMSYQGKEKVKTKVGKIWCWKLVPEVPDNKLFRGENSVTFWISADANRLPLKVEANMFFGSAQCELTSYKNVKSGIDFN